MGRTCKELITADLKKCNRCFITKPRSEFRLMKSQMLFRFCFPCEKEYNSERNNARPPHQRKMSKQTLLEQGMQECSGCKEILKLEEFSINRMSFSGRDWVCRKCVRVRSLLVVYKLSIDEYDLMLEQQEYRCAICNKHPDNSVLYVDHNRSCCPGKYSCGKCVRGLLCNTCNLLLGYAYDDNTILFGAIKYLEDWND